MMTIHQIIKIGDHHVNFCEDYALVTSIGSNKLLCAVMDGCSMGKESVFAAHLVGKILRKVAKEIEYKAFYQKEELVLTVLLKKVFQQLFEVLKLLKNQLLLETEELLTTINLLVLDQKDWSAEVLVIGDGLIVYNGELIEFEQDNKPDYLGYHLAEEFDKWFNSQKQRLTLQNITDISISTDGIFTFKEFDNEIYEKLNEDLINFLLIEKENTENPNMLGKRILAIEQRWGLRPSDDLGIIRLIK